MTVADPLVEILQEADPLVATRLGAGIARELEEVERVRDRDGAREVGDEGDAGFQRPDQDRLAAVVRVGDLLTKLLHASRERARVEIDVADSVVEQAQEALRRPYRDAIRSKSCA